MITYIVICTCLTAEYHKQLPSLLIDKGYSVRAGYSNGTICATSGVVSNIVYALSEQTLKSAAEVHADFISCLKAIKAYYYSLSVMPIANNAHVTLGNINGETDPSRILQLKALW